MSLQICHFDRLIALIVSAAVLSASHLCCSVDPGATAPSVRDVGWKLNAGGFTPFPTVYRVSPAGTLLQAHPTITVPDPLEVVECDPGLSPSEVQDLIDTRLDSSDDNAMGDLDGFDPTAPIFLDDLGIDFLPLTDVVPFNTKTNLFIVDESMAADVTAPQIIVFSQAFHAFHLDIRDDRSVVWDFDVSIILSSKLGTLTIEEETRYSGTATGLLSNDRKTIIFNDLVGRKIRTSQIGTRIDETITDLTTILTDGQAEDTNHCAPPDDQFVLGFLKNGIIRWPWERADLPIPSPDDDQDGVQNPYDRCASTPASVSIDVFGCGPNQRDSDEDGVVDALDLCPASSLELAIDANGCTDQQRDTDIDGISDAEDQCPDTMKDALVDQFGCAVTANGIVTQSWTTSDDPFRFFAFDSIIFDLADDGQLVQTRVIFSPVTIESDVQTTEIFNDRIPFLVSTPVFRQSSDNSIFGAFSSELTIRYDEFRLEMTPAGQAHLSFDFTRENEGELLGQLSSSIERFVGTMTGVISSDGLSIDWMAIEGTQFLTVSAGLLGNVNEENPIGDFVNNSSLGSWTLTN